MSDTPSITPPTPRQALIARGEQWVLVLLAVGLAAGIAYRVIDYWRVGREEMEIVSPDGGPSWRINVNAADWVTLSMVPGLGEKTARKIIELRDQRGGRLKSVDEIKDVRGIGEKTLEKLRPYLFVADPGADEEPVRMLEKP
ncbi:MAG: helix-hairpin-helix domain-containing protein [Planctomycetota bacterium]|nr:helix-hairpin-helix domain-containing protein [Planctomycetota bacterium]